MLLESFSVSPGIIVISFTPRSLLWYTIQQMLRYWPDLGTFRVFGLIGYPAPADGAKDWIRKMP